MRKDSYELIHKKRVTPEKKLGEISKRSNNVEKMKHMAKRIKKVFVFGTIGRMRKKYFAVLLCMIFAMLLVSGCGAKGGAKEGSVGVQLGEVEVYVAERLLAENVNFRVRAAWNQGSVLYVLGSSRIDEEQELLKYDLESGEQTKVILTLENDNILGYAKQAHVDDAGVLHAFCYYLNEDETEIAGYRMCSFDIEGEQKGKQLSELDVSEPFQTFLKAKTLLNQSMVLPDGRLFVLGQDEKVNVYAILLSETGEVLFRKELGKASLFDLELGDDGKARLLLRGIKESGIKIQEVDLATGDAKDIRTNVPDSPACKFLKSKESGEICFVNEDGVWSCDSTGKEPPHGLITLEDLPISRAYDIVYGFQTEDGTWRMFAVMQREAGEYNYFDYNVLLVKKSEEERKEKKEISLALVGGKSLYQESVVNFNKSREDVKIVFRDYDTVELFVTDVIAGNVPDLVDLSEPEIYYALEKKGLLEDLRTYLSKDGEISENDFARKSLQFYERDGKLYAIPYGMMISAMMGNRDYLGEREGWSFAEFRTFIDELPRPEMATKVLSKQQMLAYFCLQYLGHFVDEDEGRCDFQTEEFAELLSCANLFSQQEMTMAEIEGVFDEIQLEEVVLVPVEIGDVGSYEIWRSLFVSKGKVIGYPAESGNGICLLPAGNALAITTGCEEKETAWEFVKSMSTQKRDGFAVFPCYLPLLEEKLEKARDNSDSKEPASHLSWGSSGTMDVMPASLEEIDLLQGLLQDGSVSKGFHEAVLRIISEEAGAYFSGSKSAEQVTQLIQNRVQLYLAE